MHHLARMRELAFDIYRDGVEFYRTAGAAGGRRPESVVDGRLGWLFFLLELFRSDKDAVVRAAIIDELEWMQRYGKAHPTNNYALFTGRLGLGYANLELFRVTGETEFLKSALDLLQEYYSSASYRNGIIAKTGLFDGIAGILFLTHELYLETKASWLQEYIEVLTLKLVYSGYHGRTGIYWGGLTNLNGRNNGYAKGTAGVAMVLNRLGNSHRNNLLKKIAREAIAYEMQAGEQAGFTLGYGKTGIDLALLYSGDRSHPIDIPRPVLKDMMAAEAPGLFSGLSGIGFAYCMAARVTGDRRLQREAETLAEALTAIYAKKKRELSWTLEGAPGIGYFLLKLTSPAREEADIFFHPCVNAMDEPAIQLFQPPDTRLAETWHYSRYNHIVPALKSICPNAFDLFINGPHQTDPDRFATFAADQVTSAPTGPDKDRLRHSLEKDKFTLSVIVQASAWDIFNPLEVVETDRILRLDLAKFMELELIKSEKARVFGWETPDILDLKFTPQSLTDFMLSYGLKSYFYTISSADTLHQSPMGILKFVYDLFTGPLLVREACDQVTSFLCDQEEDVLSLMRMSFFASDNAHLRLKIGEMAVEGVRRCISENLLQQKSLHHEKNINLHRMHEPAQILTRDPSREYSGEYRVSGT
jgi:hypothetical protein